MTHRPLLLTGEPGLGKSTFARWVAANLRWRYYEHVVTSQSRPGDLLYRWDAVRRLADAQGRRVQDDYAYVDPGALWWAIDPASATRRGAPAERAERAHDPGQHWGAAAPAAAPAPHTPPSGAVLLIDEVDKAELDFPNDLLEPLDTYQFTIHEVTGAREPIRLPRQEGTSGMSSLLVVITTNQERDLPPAFVRRCVVHELTMPDPNTLIDIARWHFGEDDTKLFEGVAGQLFKLRGTPGQDSTRRPATAEYIDAVRACRQLGIRPPEGGEPASGAWQFLQGLTLGKQSVSGSR